MIFVDSNLDTPLHIFQVKYRIQCRYLYTLYREIRRDVSIAKPHFLSVYWNIQLSTVQSS